MKRSRSSGFTIIELLIATTVFSVVLLTISAAITQIGRLYYKGITSARTQEVARSVMGDIAQSIQFNVGQVVAIGPDTTDPSKNYSNELDTINSRAVCIATKHYSFKFGQQQVGSKHGLVARDVPGGCNSEPAQNLDGADVFGNELLGENMRLANLVVQPQSGEPDTYQVTVRVVYGDDDLLCNPGADSGPSSCSSNEEWTDQAEIAATRNLSCKNIRSGTQFCAASELSTIVKRRLVQ